MTQDVDDEVEAAVIAEKAAAASRANDVALRRLEAQLQQHVQSQQRDSALMWNGDSESESRLQLELINFLQEHRQKQTSQAPVPVDVNDDTLPDGWVRQTVDGNIFYGKLDLLVYTAGTHLGITDFAITCLTCMRIPCTQ